MFLPSPTPHFTNEGNQGSWRAGALAALPASCIYSRARRWILSLVSGKASLCFLRSILEGSSPRCITHTLPPEVDGMALVGRFLHHSGSPQQGWRSRCAVGLMPSVVWPCSTGSRVAELADFCISVVFFFFPPVC